MLLTSLVVSALSSLQQEVKLHLPLICLTNAQSIVSKSELTGITDSRPKDSMVVDTVDRK